MHSTVRIGGREVNRIPAADLFRLENDTTLAVEQFSADGEARVMQVTRRSQLGARVVGVHTRRFEWLPEFDGWLIADEWSGGGGSEAADGEVFFHFAGLPVILDGVVVRTLCDSGNNLALIPCNFSDAEPIATIEMGSTGYRYGSMSPAPVVRYAVAGQAFAVVACVYNEHQDFEALRKNIAARAWLPFPTVLSTNLNN